MQRMTGCFRKYTALLLVAAIVMMYVEPIPAAEKTTAATVSLKKTEGTVSVKNSSGRKLSMPSNMKLYNGYHVATQAKSYAWMELDATKLAKLDAASEVELRKNGRELELLVGSGDLFFNVTKPLDDDETLNICTSTMVAGIRGTSGWVRVIDEKCSRVYVLEGHVECSVTDPVTGQTKMTTLDGGEWADFYVYGKDSEGDKCDIVREEYEREDIPGFVQVELAEDVPLCEDIYEASGIDLRDLTREEALRRLREDEERAEETLKKEEQAKEGQTGVVSTAPVWQDGTSDDGFDTEGSDSNGGGNSPGGSSGGGSWSTTVTSYTVSFNSQRGTSVSPQSVERGGKVVKPSDPTREGYSFAGWWTTSGEGTGTEWNFTNGIVTSALTLYARWTINRYTVTFETNGGTPVTQQTVKYGEKAERPTDPGHTSALTYVFGGWYTTAELTDGTEWDFTSDTVTENVILYAKWNDGSYTVSFSTNEGSSVSPQVVAGGSFVVEPTEPVKVGYIFDGWYTTTGFDAGTQWDFATDTVTGNVTLYAKWLAVVSYTVSFDSNGGSVVGPQTVGYGEKLTKPASPTLTDCAFGGWYTTAALTDGTEWDFTADTVTADITLYAKWIHMVDYYVVSGGILGTDYTYEDGVVSVLTNEPITIRSVDPAVPSADTIVVSSASGANLTFDGVNICTDSSYVGAGASRLGAAPMMLGAAAASMAMYIENGAGDVTITLTPDSENRLISATTALVNEGNGKLTIRGGGRLDVINTARSSTSYGISCADLTIEDSELYVRGLSGGVNSSGTVSADKSIFVSKGSSSSGDIVAGSQSYTASVVFDNLVGKVYGNAVMPHDFTIEKGQYLDIPAGATLTLASNVTLKNHGGVAVEDGGTLVRSSGSGVENHYWQLEAGKIVIAEEGNMSNAFYLPWNPFKEQITEVVLEDCVTSLAGGAFSNCQNLVSATLSEKLTSIGDSAFNNAVRLTAIEIPSGVMEIGSKAFYGCTGLTELTIPDSVTSIGKDVFYNCSSLKKAIIPGSTDIEYDMFCHCGELTEVAIGDGVTGIGDGAFYGCAKLETITLPDSVTSIGVDSFAYCEALSEVDLGKGLVSIESGAFANCGSLKKITIPDGVTSIAGRAFCDCSSLQDIVIPDSVTVIETSTFYACGSLTELTIPSNVGSIGSSAFANCGNLTVVTIEDGLTEIGNSAFANCSKLEAVILPDSVTKIEDGAFKNCSSLTEITIPDGVTDIGGSMFSGCSSLAEFIISDQVTSIGVNAFNGCSSLAKITIPDSVTEIKDQAFYGCASLAKVDLGNSLTSVGYGVFYECRSLPEIMIPDGVTNICNNAFRGCSSLAKLTIPNSVTEIGAEAFRDCSGLTELTFYGATEIGNFAFEGCISLEKVDFGKSVTSIGYRAFYGCKGLEEVTIPDSVTSIGDSAFYQCVKLETVTLEDCVTGIGSLAFYGCTSLAEVDLGQAVTGIADGAFRDCGALTEITIPDSVTSIGNSAFDRCAMLTDIYYGGTEEEWENITVGTGNDALGEATKHDINRNTWK